MFFTIFITLTIIWFLAGAVTAGCAMYGTEEWNRDDVLGAIFCFFLGPIVPIAFLWFAWHDDEDDKVDPRLAKHLEGGE